MTTNSEYDSQFVDRPIFQRRRSYSEDLTSSVSAGAERRVGAEEGVSTIAAASGILPTGDRKAGTTSGHNSISESAASSSTARIRRKQSRIYDDPGVTEGYQQVPLLEVTKLPRGGVSIDTRSVGRIQFGIPPETIKDSMRLGMDVPRVYIVPVDRFCREVGPALGINLAEFEFPAYFNWFVKGKKCTLVVDSAQAEADIRTVFEETLLGPFEFRDPNNEKAWDDEDFDPTFPNEDRPNFFREFRHFRVPEEKTGGNEGELNVDVLLDFCHFAQAENVDGLKNEHIGVPPICSLSDDDDNEEEEALIDLHSSHNEIDRNKGPSSRRGARLRGIIPFHPVKAPARLGRAISEMVTDMRHIGKRRDGNARAENECSSTHKQRRRSSAEMSLGTSIRDVEKEPSSRSLIGRSDSEESMHSAIEKAPYASPPPTPAESSLDGEQTKRWLFSQVRWLGEVATVWPADATKWQIKDRSVPRVEIFKMPGGSEYIIHEVDVHNYIVGKARLKGTVEVPDEIEVEGFLASDVASSTGRRGAESDSSQNLPKSLIVSIPRKLPLPFFPPSFGITILGNSHGFDKNGSTSGYVIWINGRGVMVDPPPYSSTTLEREGIRPQTIIAIIITHCHADHDAGAFQKVLTGSRVAIITTPTIYKSFIRKYSALSGLSPRFLKHSHRFRAAIVGQPLRFQGATFHFTFSLHTIPCIGLRVEWRGLSVVFTGDHLNLPPLIAKLEETVSSRSDECAELVQLLSYLNIPLLLCSCITGRSV